jgi:hypothetical protein
MSECSWDSVVSRLGDTGFKSWRIKRFSFISETSRPAVGPTQPPSRYWVRSWEVKWLGPEVYHLPSSSTNFKNEWSFTCTRSICIYGVDRDNFSFLPSSH